MHSYTQIPTPPLTCKHTDTHSRKHRHTLPTVPVRAAFVWGQGDPVAWGPVNKHNGGLSSSTHPAGCVGLTMGGGWGVRDITTPFYCSFKNLLRKPPEIAPFTPRTDGAKSPLVTQSHAVNRWSSYWVKDRASRGGSLSIPAGNNGAAGQECCLQEEGSGRRGMLWHSQAMWALWNQRNWENPFSGGRREGRRLVVLKLVAVYQNQVVVVVGRVYYVWMWDSSVCV